MACFTTAFKKWKIGKELFSILKDDENIQALVGNNIFPVVAPEPKNPNNSIGDYIVYSREKYGRQMTKTGIVEDETIVMFSVVSNTYDKAIQIAEAIDDALTGEHTLTDGNSIDAILEDSTETFSDFRYIETIAFRIK